MIVETTPTVQVELPTDLTKFSNVARRGLMSLCALHRWRLHPTDPLPCWRIGRTWFLSEAELSAWILRRSGRTGFPSSITPAAPSPGHEKPAPPQSARRRRQIENAVAECKRRGC